MRRWQGEAEPLNALFAGDTDFDRRWIVAMNEGLLHPATIFLRDGLSCLSQAELVPGRRGRQNRSGQPDGRSGG